MIALDPAVKVYVVLVFVFALHVVLQLALETLAPERLLVVALVHVRVAVSLDVVATGAVSPAMTTGALYWNRRSPLARLGCAPRSTGSSQTASTRAQSEHAAIRHAMSSWHDCGHIPAFAGFSLSSAQWSSLPQTCVDVES